MQDVADNLKETVLSALRADPLGKSVSDVEIEPAIDDDDDEFLRVKLSITLPDRDVDSELEHLMELIEEAIARIDDRYPSVRFLDAA